MKVDDVEAVAREKLLDAPAMHDGAAELLCRETREPAVPALESVHGDPRRFRKRSGLIAPMQHAEGVGVGDHLDAVAAPGERLREAPNEDRISAKVIRRIERRQNREAQAATHRPPGSRWRRACVPCRRRPSGQRLRTGEGRSAPPTQPGVGRERERLRYGRFVCGTTNKPPPTRTSGNGREWWRRGRAVAEPRWPAIKPLRADE